MEEMLSDIVRDGFRHNQWKNLQLIDRSNIIELDDNLKRLDV